MASAIWGAIAGAGKAVSENAVASREQKDRIATIDYQAKKEEALAHVRGGIEGGLRAKENDYRLGQVGVEQGLIAGREAIAGDRSAAESLAGDTRDAAEARLKAKDDLDLQELKNKGMLDATTARGSVSSRGFKDRFKMVNKDGGEATNWAQVTQLVDIKARRAYTLQGDRFVVDSGTTDEPNAKPPPKPNQRAYDELNNAIEAGHEETINRFADTFKFLPAYAVRSLPAFIQYDKGPVSSTTDDEE